MSTKNIIIRFANASREASRNHEIMCGNPTSKEVNECSDRMEILAKAEEILFMLKDQPDLPAELVEYFEATKASNENHCNCRFSSKYLPGHEKCEAISHRLFRAREVLESFGLGIPPRHDVTFDKEKNVLVGGGVELPYVSPGENRNLIVPREKINSTFGSKTLSKFAKWEKWRKNKDRQIGLPKEPGNDPMACDVMAFMREQRESLAE